MKAVIEIISVLARTGVSQKTGNAYDMRNAQCVVQQPDRETGVMMPMIGVLTFPERLKDTAPGLYEVEFEAAIDRNGRVASEVCDLRPYDLAVGLGKSVKSMIKVLSVPTLSGVAKKTGREFNMSFAQCIVDKPDRESGEIVKVVGELLVPDRFKTDIVPGMYEVDFEVHIGQDKKIGSKVLTMNRVNPPVVARPVPAANPPQQGNRPPLVPPAKNPPGPETVA